MVFTEESKAFKILYLIMGYRNFNNSFTVAVRDELQSQTVSL